MKNQSDGGKIVFSVPGNDFPSVSVTGSRCDLMCEHCKGYFLREMEAPDSDFSSKNGILLSGGCDLNGAVPVISAINTIKSLSEKGKIVNIHCGFSSEKEIAEIGKHNVVFSVDLHQDQGVISSVLHLNKKPEDYSKLLDAMISTGKKVIPHITVGFGGDDLYMSGMLAKSKGLKKIVLLSMIPVENTVVEDTVISEEAVLEAYEMLKDMGLEVSLGCMRNRNLRTLEIRCIEAGMRRIANPSMQTISWAKEHGFEIVEEKLCCCVTL